MSDMVDRRAVVAPSVPRCVDCRHYRHFWPMPPYSKCAHPSYPRDPLTGEVAAFASHKRSSTWPAPSDCGPEGRLFEPDTRVMSAMTAWVLGALAVVLVLLALIVLT